MAVKDLIDVRETIEQATDAMAAKRVFGEPYERNGVTVIPAARFQGGAGGGAGDSPENKQTGGGTGYALSAKPAGAFVVRGEKVAWYPAVDANRVILGVFVTGIIAMLIGRSILRMKVEREKTVNEEG